MKTRHVWVPLVLGLSVWLAGCGKAEPPAAPSPLLECKDPDVQQQVIATLSPIVGYEMKDMNPGQRLVEDFGITGPARVQIRMDLESKFGIKIHEDEIKKARTVNELAAFVEIKIQKKQ